MLSIARALTLAPRLLILDEPTEGLAPVIVEEIAAIAERLKAQGLTMLLVEQNYPFAARIADRVYVLGKGRIRWGGRARGSRRERGGQAHLARDLMRTSAPACANNAPPRVRVDNGTASTRSDRSKRCRQDSPRSAERDPDYEIRTGGDTA